MKSSAVRKVWFIKLLLAVAVCFNISPIAIASDLGEPAPKLETIAWFNGDQIQLGDGSNVCVITFIESWCSSCMAALPHLNRCAERFKNQHVRFLGISIEPTETVKTFSSEQARLKVLNFPVAVDKEQHSYDAYMKAFGRTSVPNSFVVDRNGKLLWEGPPLAGLEQALDQIISNTFNLQAAKNAEAASRLQDAYFSSAEAESSFKLLSATTNTVATRELGEKILSNGASNPWLLNSFAWKILTHPKIKNRDLDLAIRASKMALDTDPTKNPSFADTHARALFLQGKMTEAIAAQRHAVEMASDPNQRSRLEKTLAGYEEASKAGPR